MPLTYKDVQKMEYDKKQLQFANDGSLCVNKKVIDDNTPLQALINESYTYLCPFCLEQSNKFTIESHGLIKCPNCQNQMRLKTLIFVTNCTNQEFAKWVYEYRLNGFFRKIDFEQWNKKLKDLGISLEFWDAYKKLKGEENTEPEPKEFDDEQLRNIINGIVNLLNKGLTKEQIILQLTEAKIEYNVSSFNYCFNEAITQIKREKEV